MKKYIYQFDSKVSQLIGMVPPSFHNVFVWLGRLTTPLMWGSFFVALHVLWLTPGEVNGAAVFILLLLPLASIMKLFFRRHRPPTIYAAAMRVKSYSFPSSHAYAAALAGGYVAVEAWHSGLPWLAGLVAIFIFTIALSRVHVGAHYPSDVLAGVGLGASILTALLLL